MPAFNKKVAAIAAGAVVDNVLAGSQWEIAPYHATYDFGMNQSAAGLVVDIMSGSDIVAESFEPPVNARYPVNPDDFILKDVVAGAERVKVRVRNTSGGALDFYLGVVITPLL